MDGFWAHNLCTWGAGDDIYIGRTRPVVASVMLYSPMLNNNMAACWDIKINNSEMLISGPCLSWPAVTTKVWKAKLIWMIFISLWKHILTYCLTLLSSILQGRNSSSTSPERQRQPRWRWRSLRRCTPFCFIQRHLRPCHRSLWPWNTRPCYRRNEG